MEQVNTFTGGLNTSTNKLLVQPNQYRDAENIRIITEGKDSTGALISVTGNKYSFTIPSTSNVLRLQINSFPTTVNFTINGTVITGLVNDYQQLSDLINTTLSPQINSATNDNLILLWSGLNINNTVYFTNIVGTDNSSPSNITFTSIIPTQDNLQIIGWGLIRDEIILCTTNSTDLNPGGNDSDLPSDNSSVGQIWRLTYDKVTYIPTLNLLYNNYLDFTSYHPFRREGQSEGRYESNTIKRFYWTDNFNTLRVFNTADLNGFALDPSILDFRGQVDMSVPILQKINESGGKLKIGVYQAAYRLKNTGGSTSVYSKCSNIVSIINGSPLSYTFSMYNGGPPSTTFQPKSIVWNIDNIDIDFDRIEIVILFRENKDDAPTIDKIIDEPVPQTGSFLFTYTGFETKTPVDINSLVDITSAFTHCKTIVSKDNLLLAGNTRNKTFDVDYDARAYRFPQKTSSEWQTTGIPTGFATRTTVKNKQGNSLTVDSTILNWGVPEEHDAINPDQNSQTINSYRFQSDGLTHGGEGPNIKYKFTTRWFIGDQNLASGTAGAGYGNANFDISNGPIGKDSRFTLNQPGPFILNNNSFPNNNFFDSFKSEYIASAFKGYQHDEIVPFAIRFFDKQGRPGEAKWIADIRMPLIYESIDTSTGTYSSYLTTKLSTFGTFTQQEIGILLPEFTVNIPNSLKSKISGFEIVRCERKTEDRTVLGAGTIHNMIFYPFANEYYTCIPDDGSFNAGATIFTTDIVQGRDAFFVSPEFEFTSFPGWQSGDSIKVVASLNQSYVKNSVNPSGLNGFKFSKLYTTSPVSGLVQERSLNAAFELGPNADGTMPGGQLVRNRTNSANSGPQSQGNTGVVIEWFNSGTGLNMDFSSVAGSTGKLYAYYKRTRVNAYGGNTFTARANREYISCGHYQSTNNQSNTTFVVQLAGGDIYTTIFDIQKNFKSWANSGSFKVSATYYFPVETISNTEWRYGNFINRFGIAGSGSGTNDFVEDFLVNTVFSAEDNTKKAFPKPSEFIDIQENDNRIYASEFKINGELVDSWGIFPVEDFMDVDGQYGPINNLLILKGNVYGLQDTGCFIIPVNQKVVIPDNSASTLILGKGEKLVRPAYISTMDGCIHQWGNISTEDAIYFWNSKNLTINKLTDQSEPLSFIEGIQSFFDSNIQGQIKKRDNTVHDTRTLPRAGVVFTYDSSNYEVLGTFHDYTIQKSAFTICYNEIAKVFTSRYSFKPGIYINDKSLIFTPDILNTRNVYLHGIGNPGQFYDINYPSTVKLVISTQAKEAVFDNFEWDSQVTDLQEVNITDETWNQLRVYNDYQNSDYQQLIVDRSVKRKKRSWNTIVPRSIIIQNPKNLDIFNPVNLNPLQLFKPRMRGKFILVDLSFPNISNGVYRYITCPFIKTISRVSAR